MILLQIQKKKLLKNTRVVLNYKDKDIVYTYWKIREKCKYVVGQYGSLLDI